MDYLGITFIDDGGDNEVLKLFGKPGTMTAEMEINYFGGTSPHYSVDRITALSGVMFSCDGDFGRMVMKQAGNHKVVSSSVVMGAMADGDSLNLKPYLIAEMIYKFLDYNPSVSVEEPGNFSICAQNIPNPFRVGTSICFDLPNSGHVNVEIVDITGKLVKILFDSEMDAGSRSVWWDCSGLANDRVGSGLYFYRITTGNSVAVGKMTVL